MINGKSISEMKESELFALYLKGKRTKLGYTILEMSNLLGVPRSSYVNWETCCIPMPFKQALEIIDMLGDKPGVWETDLKKLRKDNHLTQERVAEAAGLSPRSGYISKYELGKMDYSIDTWHKIVAAIWSAATNRPKEHCVMHLIPDTGMWYIFSLDSL